MSNILKKIFKIKTSQNLILYLQLVICYLLIFLIFVFEFNYFTLEKENIEKKLINRKLISDSKIENIKNNKIFNSIPLIDSENYQIFSIDEEIYGTEVINCYFNEKVQKNCKRIINDFDVLVSSSLKDKIVANKLIVKFRSSEMIFNVIGFIKDSRRYIVVKNNIYRDMARNDESNLKFQIIVDNYKSINAIKNYLTKKGFHVYKSEEIQEFEIQNIYRICKIANIFKIIFIIIILVYFMFLIRVFFIKNKDNLLLLTYLGLKNRKIKLTLFKIVSVKCFISLICSNGIGYLFIKVFKMKIYKEECIFFLANIFITIIILILEIERYAKKRKDDEKWQ